MKASMKRAAILSVALAAAVSIGTMTALAAGTEETSYGYLTGQRESAGRHEQFVQAAELETDSQREAFYAEKEIGGGACSASLHLDAGALMEAGIIDQETADRIAAYAAGKNEDLHARYAEKSSMTPQERHTFYQGFKSDGADGDPVEELLSAGIITREQADAISAYLGK